PLAAIGEGLRSFRPLAHRLEPVREVGGVRWINDSKATNIASTVVAVEAMDRPFVLLLGGRHKGEPYTRLAPLLKDRCRLVIAYGEAGPLVAQDLGGQVPLERGTTFEDVVARARRAAQPGDAVLLSPACSSYDLKQALGAAVGGIVAALLARSDYRKWQRAAWPVLAVVAVLLLLPLLPFTERIAPNINGARRWVNLGFVTVQPSELAKFAV